jgi:hypothetical protein
VSESRSRGTEPAILEALKQAPGYFCPKQLVGTGPREQREELWKAVTDLHAQRSPEQVERMEREMGLR